MHLTDDEKEILKEAIDDIEYKIGMAGQSDKEDEARQSLADKLAKLLDD